MRLELVFPGKTKESYLKDGVHDFQKRLSHFTKIEFKINKPLCGTGDNVRNKKLEGEQLLENCSKAAYKVALDPKGKQLSSEEFAVLIDKWENQGRQVISFLIGGPEGLSDKVVERADMIFSLSKMTFTHEMARLLLLEQIYRAYNIKAGTKYHK